MSIFNDWSWQGLGDAIFNPKAEGVESKIENIKSQLPSPVFFDVINSIRYQRKN